MRAEQVIEYILIANFAVAVIYLIAGLVRGKDRKKTVICFFLMIMIPVFFIVYQLLTAFFTLVTRLMHPDLSDVIFRKDKVSPLERGDAESESNLVPIEEALAVSDQSSLRTFMLNVLKGDISDSLGKLSEALVSGDTETAHYAATVLREELGKFRSTVYRSLAAIENSKGQERDETCVVTIRFMNEFLKKGIFAQDEAYEYAMKLADIADIVFDDDYKMLEADDYYNICQSLLEAKIYSRCRQWCIRLSDMYPDSRESYMATISYAFETGRSSQFARELDRLMKSGVPVDEETVRHIRAFR